jgi:signal transduction histidine kinase
MNQRRTRKYTVMLLEAMDRGVMDARSVAEMCLGYMSEAEVEDMCRVNDLKTLMNYDDEEDAE